MRVPAAATEFRVALDRGRTGRWPVVAGECPIPPSGTVLQFVSIERDPFGDVASSPSSARLEGSELVIDGLPNSTWFTGAAVASDGARAAFLLQASADRGPAISFMRPRNVDVVLRDDGGKPVVGMPVVLVANDFDAVADAAPTDDDGRARFRCIFAKAVKVRAVDGMGSLIFTELGTTIGEVDLSRGDGRLDAVIHAARVVRILVTIDGKPALPGTFQQLIVKNKVFHRIDEDPIAGEIRAEWRGFETELPIYLSAPGYTDAYGTLREESPGGPLSVRLEMISGGSMLVRVIPPADGVFDVAGVGPPGGGTFGSFRASQPVIGEPNLWRLENLRPGPWSAMDAVSGISAEPVDVKSGALAGEVQLDLSHSGVVRGRVEIPDGYQIIGTGIVREGGGTGSRSGLDAQRGQPVRGDGTFEMRIAGDRPVTISATHPLLKPAAVGGSITLSAPQDGVVLRMVAGPQATFRSDPVPTPPSGVRAARMFLFRGSVGGTPAARIEADIVDGVVRFGGFEPGTYSVVIDAYGLAPLFLEKVVLTDGPTDLGVLRLASGASVRVKVLVKDGQIAPGLDVTARSKFDPDHWRQVHSFGDAEVVVRGLGKGSYKLTVRSLSNDKTFVDKTIESDGVGETTVTVDLR